VAKAVRVEKGVEEVSAEALARGLSVTEALPLPLPALLVVVGAPVGLSAALREPATLLLPPALLLAAAVALAREGLGVASAQGVAVELALRLRVAAVENRAGLLGVLSAVDVPEGLEGEVALALALVAALGDPPPRLEALVSAVRSAVAVVASLPDALAPAEAEAAPLKLGLRSGESVESGGVKVGGVLLLPPPPPPLSAVALAQASLPLLLPLAEARRCSDGERLPEALAQLLALVLAPRTAEGVAPAGSEAVGPTALGVAAWGVAEALEVGWSAESVGDCVALLALLALARGAEGEAASLPALLAVAATLSEARAPLALPDRVADTEGLGLSRSLGV
jgi:hypothetical protein